MSIFKLPKAGWRAIGAILLFGMIIMPDAFARDVNQGASGKTSPPDNWSFGQSADRHAPLWIKGIAAEDISNNARPKIKKRKNAADTSHGIDAALSRAEAKDNSRLGLKMKNETSSWKVTPDQANVHPDENIAREGKHILGAYAGVNASDNLNISVGPELILKDEQNVRENSNASQPDAALGLGMNFKFDF